MDRDTHKLFYDKLLLVYLELPGFEIAAEDLKTGVERWMYVLKHLSKLNELPDALHNKIFTKFFEQAKIANMTPDEIKQYDQSLKNYRDMYTVFNEYKSELAASKKMLASMSKTIAIKDKALASNQKALASKDKALQKALAEITKLQRKYGINSETGEKGN